MENTIYVNNKKETYTVLENGTAMFNSHLWGVFRNESELKEFGKKLNGLSEAYINGPYFDPAEV